MTRGGGVGMGGDEDSEAALSTQNPLGCCWKVALLCNWREDVCRSRAFQSESGLI